MTRPDLCTVCREPEDDSRESTTFSSEPEHREGVHCACIREWERLEDARAEDLHLEAGLERARGIA